MFLYHGSTVEIKEIDLNLSKPNKDFGRGFYLSDNFGQAYEMATYKAGLFGTEPYVIKFEFDESLLKNGSLKVLSFSELNNRHTHTKYAKNSMEQYNPIF